MLIQNYNAETPNILHFQGKSPIMDSFFTLAKQGAAQLLSSQFPSDLTIITTSTDDTKSILITQLKSSGIPFINSYKNEYGEFAMTDKIKYIINALNETTTKYVLILDGYDVIIQDFVNIIERFEEYHTHMLFNASKNNFPVCVIDRIPQRDYIGQWNHFNAGCAIGYTSDFIDFYQKAYELMNKPNFHNPYHSEQFILRHIFAEYSKNCISDSPYITFDYRCRIFIALSQAYVVPQDEEKTHFIAY